MRSAVADAAYAVVGAAVGFAFGVEAGLLPWACGLVGAGLGIALLRLRPEPRD